MKNSATLTDRAELMAGAMMAGVLLTLWLALRSFKVIFAILVTLAVGLVITMAIGLLAVGVFNIISIAFIALFVGLGVGFRHPVLGALSQRTLPAAEPRQGRCATPAAVSACRWRWRRRRLRSVSSRSCRPNIPAWPNWALSPASA